MPWNPEHYSVKPKVIHTRTFSCFDDHPIVYYTFDDENKAICEYCSAQFVYEPKKKLLPLTDHYVPGITESPTHSEEMQDNLEPIPDDVDYAQADDETSDNDYVNKILKGSG